MIQIEVGKSKQFAVLILFLYSASLCLSGWAIFTSHLSGLWLLGLSPLIAYFMYVSLYKHALRQHPKAITELHYFPHDGLWQLTDKSRKTMNAEIAGHLVVTNAFILLHFNKTVTHSLMIWRDAVPERQFRQLRHLVYQAYGESHGKP